MPLTVEELSALEASPVCLNCTHRELLHQQDSEYGTECHVCGCQELVKDGDYSYWSIGRYSVSPIVQQMQSLLDSRLDLEYYFSQERVLELPLGKTLRVVKYKRLNFPSES